jgi:hypothetical protein
MGWKKEDLFRLMKTWNEYPEHRIFDLPNLSIYEQYGCPVEDAVRFFEDSLFELLKRSNFYACVNSDFVKVSYYGRGDVDDIEYSKRFNLTAEQCIEIAYYVDGRLFIKSYDEKPRIHWSDFYVVLNYIYKNIPLNDLAYRFVYTGDVNIPNGFREDSGIKR